MVRGKNFKFKARQLYYQLKERVLIARGDVTLEGKDFYFKAFSLTYDLKLKVLYCLGVWGKVKNYYISAERVVLFPEGEILIYNAQITTCPTKEALLCILRAKVDRKYLFSYSNTLKVFNQRLLYSPLLLIPVGKRRSGLLPSTLGSNTFNEIIFIQPLYLVLSKDKDLTLTYDFRNRQGEGFGLEFRKALEGKRSLKIYLESHYERRRGEWLRGKTDIPKSRYYLKVIGDFGKFNLKVESSSDPFLLEDYALKRSLTSKPYLETYLNFTKEGGDYLFYFKYYSPRDTLNTTKSFSLSPEALLYLKPRRLYRFLYFDLETLYSRVENYNRRFILDPSLFYRYKNFFFKLKGLGRIYENRGFITYLLNAQYLLSSSLGKLSLLLIPRYSFSPKDYLKEKFDRYDEVNKKNEISLLGLINYKSLSLFLEGGYNFLGGYFLPSDNYFLEKKLLPLKLFTLFKFKGFNLSDELYYDFNLKATVKHSLRLSYKGKGEEIVLLNSFARDHLGKILTNQVSLKINKSLGKFLLSTQLTRDLLNEQYLYKSFLLGYKSNCFMVGISLKEEYRWNLNRNVRELLLYLEVFNLRKFKLRFKRS